MNKGISTDIQASYSDRICIIKKFSVPRKDKRRAARISKPEGNDFEEASTFGRPDLRALRSDTDQILSIAG
jgi:hypothetical protein